MAAVVWAHGRQCRPSFRPLWAAHSRAEPRTDPVHSCLPAMPLGCAPQLLTVPRPPTARSRLAGGTRSSRLIALRDIRGVGAAPSEQCATSCLPGRPPAHVSAPRAARVESQDDRARPRPPPSPGDPLQRAGVVASDAALHTGASVTPIPVSSSSSSSVPSEGHRLS